MYSSGVPHPFKEHSMNSTSTPANSVPLSQEKTQPPRLLDQLIDAAQRHGHAPDAATRIADWCQRYILFHGRRHPRELGRAEVGQFLDHVAASEKDPLRALDAA